MALTDSTWYTNFGDGSTTGYYAITRRPQNAAVAAGQIVRQFTAPAVGSERVFVCIIAGTTANVTDATWALTRGAKTTDGTATWMECSGQAALNGDLTNTSTWAQAKAATPAVLGQIIKRSNNASYQICTTAGAMSASEPAFSDTAGVTTTDTTAVWTSLGAVTNFTGGQAPHARLVNVFGVSWFASGNTVYVADNHAETQSANSSMSPASSLMAKILCHNHSGSYPPAASDITTGATVTVTTGAVFFAGQGSFYFYGITFVSAVASTLGPTAVGQVQNWYYFDNCSWQFSAAGANSFTLCQSTAWDIITFNNTTLKVATTTFIFIPYFCQFIWQNTGSILVSGSSVPTTLFNTTTTGRFANVTLNNLDLSQLTGSLFSNSNASSIGTLIVQDCKLNASMTVTTPINTGMNVQLIRSDSAGTSYKSTRYAYEGIETTETSIVRTGGAVDPTGQVQSRKLVTSANTQWLRPFKAEPMVVWNQVTGTNRVVTVYGTVNAGALPNNDDIWLECEYLGDAGAIIPATPTTLNPADKDTHIALSGGNLTAVGTAGWTGLARAVDAKSAGKFYWECTFNAAQIVSGVGLAIGSLSVATTVFSTVVNGHSGVIQAGTVYVDGSNSLTVGGVPASSITFGSITSGTVICVAVDLTAKLIWFRLGAGGNWNNVSGRDPATGVGGVSVPNVGTTYPTLCFGGADTLIANFGATSFTGAVPSGFTSGWVNPAIPATPSPLGKIVTTTKASVLASNVAVASDGSAWGGGGSGAGWSPFKLTATLSSPQPQLPGYLHARIRAAKASTTYYIDPQINLS